MPFELKRPSIRIKIIDPTETPPVEVVYEVREPDADEWLAYQRASQRVRFVGAKDGAPTFETAEDKGAAIALWNAIIIGLEGFTLDGEPATQPTDEVRALVPPRHMFKVADLLSRTQGLIEEHDRKNSSPPSAPSDG